MNSGVLPTLVVLVLWGLWPLVAKISVGRIGTQALWWSYWSGLVVVGAYLLWRGETPLLKDGLGLVAALTSGVLVAAGSLLFYELLRRHPASVVAFLTGLYPVVSALVSWVALREPPSPAQAAGMLLAAGAIVLLSR